MFLPIVSLLAAVFSLRVSAFDNSRYDNVGSSSCNRDIPVLTIVTGCYVRLTCRVLSFLAVLMYAHRYWGQNSYGAANPGDTAHYQQRLSFYCNV